MRPVAVAVLLMAAGVRPAHGQANEILGTWRGTSTCVKEAWNSACNDEQVVYYVTPVAGRPDSVSLDARKLVNGTPAIDEGRFANVFAGRVLTRR